MSIPMAWRSSAPPPRRRCSGETAGGGVSGVRLCGGMLVQWRDGVLHVLLGKRAMRRAAYPGVWDVLGGHCEPGEAPEQTLVRELQEEIGVTPTVWRALGDLRAAGSDGSAPLVLHVYAVTAWTGTPHNRQPEEHDELGWFTVDDACGLDLAHPAYPALFQRLAMVR